MNMYEAEEYLDCTVTVGLAVAMAKKYKESVDTAVRKSSLAVSKRAQFPRVKHLYLGISKEETPAAMFKMISDQVFSAGTIIN